MHVAILIDTILENNTIAKNAYHKIQYVRFAPPNSLSIHVDIFESEDARKLNNAPIESRAYLVNFKDIRTGDSTFLALMYNNLNELPEYSNGKNA